MLLHEGDNTLPVSCMPLNKVTCFMDLMNGCIHNTVDQHLGAVGANKIAESHKLCGCVPFETLIGHDVPLLWMPKILSCP